MRYQYPATYKFWFKAYKLFHAKFLRFMGGPKGTGHLVDGKATRGYNSPLHCDINFAVPKVDLIRSECSQELMYLKPGILDTALEALKTHSVGST